MMEEDGEIFEVEQDDNQQSDFSMSSYDGDNGDSLDIKPPQAQLGSVKEKREKREKRDRHHRHKNESGGHRHKSDRHRSRSDHRSSSDRHSREKRKHREDRSESGTRRHRGHGSRSSSSHAAADTLTPAAGEFLVAPSIVSSSRSKGGDKDRSSRASKREAREHRHGRSSSQQQHMDHDSSGGYYDTLPPDDRLGGMGGLPPLLPDPAPLHHHNSHHQQQQQYQSLHHQSSHHHGSSGGQHHGHHRSRGGQQAMQQNSSLLQLSPHEMAEREKRMERMMAAEKQKEQSQREAESRRMRKEEEKRVDPAEYHHHQQQQGSGYHHHQSSRSHHHQGSGGSSGGRSNSSTGYHRSSSSSLLAAAGGAGGGSAPGGSMGITTSPPMSPPVMAASPPHHRQHKKKKHRKDSPPAPAEEVHVISENEEEEVEEAPKEEEEEKPKEDVEMKEEEATEGEEGKKEEGTDGSDSGSSDSSSDSDSDSDSSDSDDEEGEKKKEDVNGNKTESGASTPDKEGRFDDSPRSGGGVSDASPVSGEMERSPTRSPVPLKEQLPNYYPAIMGCRSVDEFECLNRIAEGTYGVVYRAREKCNNTIVALKRLKMEKEKEGFPITSLREINTLLKGQHTNIVTVREIVVGSNMDKIYIVMDYVEHDLKSLMETMNKKKQSFSLGEVKTLMMQLLNAVHHLHDNWILHRDLKTSNLLLSHTGILKVGDFGLAREYGSPLKQYTPIVVTLWYRAPELLLGTKYYSTAIDAWSVGCIFGEMLAMEPMFPGKSEIDELNRIFKELGTPSDSIWPGYSQLPVVKRTQFTDFPYNHLREHFKERLSDKGFQLMNKFLTYDPAKRITCQEALLHEYFKSELPNPVPSAMFPTWPAKSEHPNGISAADEPNRPPKPPSGGKNFKDLGDDDHGVTGFYLGGGQQGGPGFQLKF